MSDQLPQDTHRIRVYCVDCAQCLRIGPSVHQCLRAEQEAEAAGQYSLVTGMVSPQPCELVRADSERCGPSGAWFVNFEEVPQ